IIDVDVQRIGRGGTNQLTTTLRSVSSLDLEGNIKGNPDMEALEYWQSVVSKATQKAIESLT
ncbi:TPA: hypothetical protein N1368_004782, partial [Salmonella enterica subsp. enterica serovar Agona]|nr:hypothetical protein [Salmonella enterica subsp. enterica serovar Agona]